MINKRSIDKDDILKRLAKLQKKVDKKQKKNERGFNILDKQHKKSQDKIDSWFNAV